MPGVTPAEVLSNFGITLVEDPADNQPRLLVDLPAAELVEYAIRREEGRMASNGALVIETGERTGRSPNDRFIVDTPDVHDKIAWGAVNRPLSIESYETIKAGIVDYLNERDGFVPRGMAAADRNHTRRLLVACERASQALFIKQMLARPLAREIARTGEPDFCVLAAPGYQCDPAIKGLNSSAAVVINFQERVILVAGTGYSGEIKKSIFSVMNYLLPVEDDVLPMHCSASMDPVTHETAVFFGLSGTGKTTLSANPTRLLIGDDEHGWASLTSRAAATPSARAWMRSTSPRSSTLFALAPSAKTWCSMRIASLTMMTSRSRTIRAWPIPSSTFPTRGPRAWAPPRALCCF